MFQYDPLSEYQLARSRQEEIVQQFARMRLLDQAAAQNPASVSRPLAEIGSTIARFGRALRGDRPSAAAVAAAEAMLRETQRESIATRR
jgi:hypothetical protein